MRSFTVSTIGEDVVKDLFKKADMTLSLFEMTRKGFLTLRGIGRLRHFGEASSNCVSELSEIAQFI
jgi:hypothetical protein